MGNLQNRMVWTTEIWQDQQISGTWPNKKMTIALKNDVCLAPKKWRIPKFQAPAGNVDPRLVILCCQGLSISCCWPWWFPWIPMAWPGNPSTSIMRGCFGSWFWIHNTATTRKISKNPAVSFKDTIVYPGKTRYTVTLCQSNMAIENVPSRWFHQSINAHFQDFPTMFYYQGVASSPQKMAKKTKRG